MIEIYNKEEQKIINKISNIEIQAFNNLTFNIVGYPHRINDETRLINYLDTMHENKKYFTDNFKIYLEDKDLISKALDFVEKFSFNKFNKKITPIYSLFSAYEMLKLIEPFIEEIKKKKKVKILEIGPGSGMLGILLNLKYTDIKYASTDNSQAFYILQSALYKELDENYSEHLYEKKQEFFDEKSKIAHVPWWVFLKNENLKNDEFDIIICDHALAEMNRYCLSFYLKRSSKFLQKTYYNNNVTPYFIYHSLGKLVNSEKNIFKEFYKQNFLLAHSSDLQVFTINNIDFGKFNFLKKIIYVDAFMKKGKMFGIYRRLVKFLLNCMLNYNYKTLVTKMKMNKKTKDNDQSFIKFVSKREIYYSDDHKFLFD